MPHRYSPAQIATVYRVIAERRDMRHFLPDPIDPAVLARLLEAAHRGPSVGLMQPWRFVRITDSGLRDRIHALVADEGLTHMPLDVTLAGHFGVADLSACSSMPARPSARP